jgi:hypothetical protein
MQKKKKNGRHEEKNNLSNIMDVAGGGLGSGHSHYPTSDGRDATHARRELRV